MKMMVAVAMVAQTAQYQSEPCVVRLIWEVPPLKSMVLPSFKTLLAECLRDIEEVDILQLSAMALLPIVMDLDERVE